MIVPYPLNPSELITVIFIIRRKVFGNDKGMVSRAEVERSAFNEVGMHTESLAQHLYT